jgi:hypothetical protein
VLDNSAVRMTSVGACISSSLGWNRPLRSICPPDGPPPRSR